MSNLLILLVHPDQMATLNKESKKEPMGEAKKTTTKGRARLTSQQVLQPTERKYHPGKGP